METTNTTPTSIAAPRTHPMLLVAAASVTLFSLAGVGTLAGWLPGPGSRNIEVIKVASAAPMTPDAKPVPAVPISLPPAVTVPQERSRPVAKSASVTRPPAKAPATVHSAPPMAANTSPSAVPPAPTLANSAPPPICRDCGVVQAVNQVAVEAKGSGGGAVAGGLLGGIVGNQIGKGSTRDIATILGAVGGAYGGNYVEKSIKQSKRYDVLVRFEDGRTRTFSSESAPAWQSGDRVRLQNGALTMDGSAV